MFSKHLNLNLLVFFSIDLSMVCVCVCVYNIYISEFILQNSMKTYLLMTTKNTEGARDWCCRAVQIVMIRHLKIKMKLKNVFP